MSSDTAWFLPQEPFLCMDCVFAHLVLWTTLFTCDCCVVEAAPTLDNNIYSSRLHSLAYFTAIWLQLFAHCALSVPEQDYLTGLQNELAFLWSISTPILPTCDFIKTTKWACEIPSRTSSLCCCIWVKLKAMKDRGDDPRSRISSDLLN